MLLKNDRPDLNTGSNVCRANYFSCGTRFMAYRRPSASRAAARTNPEPKTVTGLYHFWYLTLTGKA